MPNARSFRHPFAATVKPFKTASGKAGRLYSLPALAKQFPNVKFLGWRFGEELAKAYSSADVLVFPSRTDTFGMVMIEANACGTPIAAYNVCGPVDIVKNGENGWLDEDLDVAIQNALSVSRKSCVKSSLVWDWEIAAKMLLEK